MLILRTPSKGYHNRANGHDFFELIFFALSCRQKLSRKDAEAPSINFQKCGQTEEKFCLPYLIEHLAARAGEPATLMPREVKYGSNKVAAPRPFVFSLGYVGGCRRQIHSHADTQHTTNVSCLELSKSWHVRT